MKKEKLVCDVLIIGSGVTGLATAMYTARFGLKTIVVGDSEGGIITTTHEVSNYPGFKQVTGLELFQNIKNHALTYPVQLQGEKIEEITKTKKGFLSTSQTSTYESKTIIFATGTKHRELGIPGEKEYFGKGVHTCALCDGPFYKEKTLGVIGGSDSAVKEALLLSEYAKKVYLIYRGEKVRAEPINTKKLEQNKKITIIYNTNITNIQGEKNVTQVTLDKKYKEKNTLKLDAVFIAIGSIPLSNLAKKLGVQINKKGEIKINRNSETNIEGIYAAGDVVDSEFKQAITGVAEGVTASYHSYEYIQKNK
jgi:thioredoxin reductase (NADPH)